MYLYEELDYNQIMNHSEIDPNSAEAYYALAQCFRLGKGIEPNMDMYQEYLSYAADEGHEEAARELGTWQGTENSGDSAVAGTMISASKENETNYETMTVSELRRLSNLGDAAAAFRLYSISKNIGDMKNAALYLKCAGDHAEKNGVEKAAGQKIFMALGEWYKQGAEKDLQKSLLAYEMAAELGSSQACNYLSGCYRNGTGGVLNKDPEQAERYRRMVARNGSVGERYRLAVTYMKENENLLAVELLQQVVSETDPKEDFYLLSRIQLGRMDSQNYSCEELVERLWERADQTVNQKLAKEAKTELLKWYKEGPAANRMSETLHGALTPERAYLFGIWCKNSDPTKAKQWFAWAARDCEAARNELVAIQAEEEERKKQKSLEDERKREDAAALVEKKRNEAVEREARKKRKADEKAERDRLAAIEEEERRREKEEQERELQEKKRLYQRLKCRQDVRNYALHYVKYLVIAGVWAFVGLIAALLTFNESKETYLFCRWFGTAGAVVWISFQWRMFSCVKALKHRYPDKENHQCINRWLNIQRFLMWAVGLVWMINGVVAENMSWIGFLGSAAAVIGALILLEYILGTVFDWWPLEYLESWLSGDEI